MGRMNTIPRKVALLVTMIIGLCLTSCSGPDAAEEDDGFRSESGSRRGTAPETSGELRPLLAMALADAGRMTSPDEAARAYCRVAEAASDLGDTSSARTALEAAANRIQDVSVSVSRADLHIRIANAFISLGKNDAAKEQLEHALRIARSGRRSDENWDTVLVDLADRLSSLGDAKAAATVASMTTTPKGRARALTSIAGNQYEAGERAVARRNLLMAEDAIEEIHNQTSRGDCLIGVITALARAEEIGEARLLADRITRPLTQVEAYKRIICEQARSGDFGGAMTTAAFMPMPAPAYVDIGQMQLAAGDHQGMRQSVAWARSVTQECTRPDTQVWNYCGIAGLEMTLSHP